MSLLDQMKEKAEKALKAMQEQTQKQFEKSKEAIKNYKPNQLHKKIAECNKDIEKYEIQLKELEHKKKEFEFKLSLAKQEKELAETKLKEFE